MARTARLDATGVLKHVMIRGIEGKKIFQNNKDRDDFIERLETLCPQMQITCYAWAFMSNHAHFLFRNRIYSWIFWKKQEGRKPELTGGGLIRSLGGWT